MLKYFNLWIAFTLILFYFGPVDWDGRSSLGVLLVVVSNMLFFNFGALFGGQIFIGRQARVTFFERNRRAAYVVMAAHVGLTAIALHASTGLWLFDPSAYSFDFGGVYSNFSQIVAERPPSGGAEYAIVITKAIVFSLALYVATIYFNEDTKLSAIFFLPLIASSLLRGTDKEFIDVFLIGITLYFLKRKNRVAIWPILSVVAVVVYFFLERRYGRFNGNFPSCVGDGQACFRFDGFIALNISPIVEIAYVFLTNYITQGYEALSIALTTNFEPNYGVGHLPLVKQVLCSVLNTGCEIGNYQQKLTELGWDTSVRWTSVYPIIANDFSWYFSFVYFFAFGAHFGFAQRMWTAYSDRISVVIIVLTSIFIAYSSANMQISVSFDWLFVTLIFFTIQVMRVVVATNAKKRIGA